jgi:hypothetical protein
MVSWREAAGIGRHAGDADLVALALHVQCRALVLGSLVDLVKEAATRSTS